MTAQKIEISHRTIIFTVILLISLWFLYFIRQIILQFFIALLIMAILNPLVTKLSRFRIPRAVSILFAYLIFFSVVSLAIAGVVPPLIDQTTSFINGLPGYIEAFGSSNVFAQQILKEALSQVGRFPSQIARAGVSILSNIIDVFTILIFAFYLLLSRDNLNERSEVFFGNKARKEFEKILDLLEKKLGGWVIGQLSLMFLVGISTYFGLQLLRIPFALPLSILSGLLEVVPYVGPIIAAVPATIIGLSISPLMGLAAASLAFLVQQFENYIFVPKVMEKSVGVSPIATLLALAIGFKVAGITGVVISVPVVITLQIVGKEYVLSR